MLFSERHEAATKATKWMETHNVPQEHVYNIVTALDALGYLRTSAPTPPPAQGQVPNAARAIVEKLTRQFQGERYTPEMETVCGEPSITIAEIRAAAEALAAPQQQADGRLLEAAKRISVAFALTDEMPNTQQVNAIATAYDVRKFRALLKELDGPK